MTRARLQEIRRQAKASDARLIVEELCIEIENLQLKEFPLKDVRVPKTSARGTLEEFEAYAKELGLHASDGTACFHKFEANGWRIGPNPVKDWRAAIRSWKAAGYLPSQKGAGRATSQDGPIRTRL